MRRKALTRRSGGQGAAEDLKTIRVHAFLPFSQYLRSSALMRFSVPSVSASSVSSVTSPRREADIDSIEVGDDVEQEKKRDQATARRHERAIQVPRRYFFDGFSQGTGKFLKAAMPLLVSLESSCSCVGRISVKLKQALPCIRFLRSGVRLFNSAGIP